MKKFIISVLFLLLTSALFITFYRNTDFETFSLKHSEDHIVISHEGEPQEMILHIAEELKKTQIKAESFFKQNIPQTSLYIFKDHKQFQFQKYGYISKLIDLPWYIGDNIGPTALIVSPNTKLSHHNYDSVIGAIPHEYVHTVMYRLYPDSSLWLNEGVTLYLTNRETRKNLLKTYTPPDLSVLKSSNPIVFGNNNGYFYADKMVEYMIQTFGKEKLFQLLEGKPYKEVTGMSLKELWDKVLLFIDKNY